MTQHTPGPWTATFPITAPGKRDAWVISGGGGRSISILPDTADMQNDAANAALIAAAPDLLKACKVALGTLNTMMDIERTRTELAAVIAKAEGR